MNPKQIQKKSIIKGLSEFKNAWMVITSICVILSSGAGVVLANGKKVVNYLVNENIDIKIEKAVSELDKKFQYELQCLGDNIRENQAELLSILVESDPKIKKVADKRIEQKKASKALQIAIEKQ